MIKLPGGTFCTMDHAIEFARNKARADQEKKARAKHREDLRRVRRNPRAEALKAAQLLARISAADDNGYCACVTCSKVRLYNSGMDGGHFIPKGSSSIWMLDPRNIHPQCSECNRMWSSGGKMKTNDRSCEYTLWMIDQYGREFVDHMLSKQRVVIKRSTADYDEFIEKAKAEIALHKKRISISKT